MRIALVKQIELRENLCLRKLPTTGPLKIQNSIMKSSWLNAMPGFFESSDLLSLPQKVIHRDVCARVAAPDSKCLEGPMRTLIIAKRAARMIGRMLLMLSGCLTVLAGVQKIPR